MNNASGNYVSGEQYAGHRIVTIGGGTGTFSLLSHLKKYLLHISAIVTMSDSGGSSRMLMDEFQRQLPLGDLRMSLVALARNGALWREVFMHRFERAENDEARQKMRGVVNLSKKCCQTLAFASIHCRVLPFRFSMALRE